MIGVLSRIVREDLLLQTAFFFIVQCYLACFAEVFPLILFFLCRYNLCMHLQNLSFFYPDPLTRETNHAKYGISMLNNRLTYHVFSKRLDFLKLLRAQNKRGERRLFGFLADSVVGICDRRLPIPKYSLLFIFQRVGKWLVNGKRLGEYG